MTQFLNFLKSCIRIFWNLSHMLDIYHKKNTQTITEAHSVHPCTLTTYQFKVSGSQIVIISRSSHWVQLTCNAVARTRESQGMVPRLGSS